MHVCFHWLNYKKEKIENYNFSSDRADIIESAEKFFKDYGYFG